MLRLAFATAAFGKGRLSFHLMRLAVDKNCITCLLGILYYDYFITLGMEIELYWRKPMSLGSFGFFLNRYLSVLGYIPAMIEFYGSIRFVVSCYPILVSLKDLSTFTDPSPTEVGYLFEHLLP